MTQDAKMLAYGMDGDWNARLDAAVAKARADALDEVIEMLAERSAELDATLNMRTNTNEEPPASLLSKMAEVALFVKLVCALKAREA